jgi:hypothetical protein
MRMAREIPLGAIYPPRPGLLVLEQWIGYGWDIWARAAYEEGGIVVFTDANAQPIRAFAKARVENTPDGWQS